MPFSKFFEGKPTEHLLGKGITAEQINDDRIGKVLDDLHEEGLSETFLGISLKAVAKYEVKLERGHVDSTSFPSDWVGLTQAAKLLDTSYDCLAKKLSRIESDRISGVKTDWKLGKHYRRKPQSNRWQVNCKLIANF